MPEVKKQSAYSKALHNNNEWLLKYAKFMCAFSGKGRLKIYRKLAALLKNRFSLMNALEMIYNGLSEEGKHPNNPLAVSVAAWGRALQEGHPFSDCLKGCQALQVPVVRFSQYKKRAPLPKPHLPPGESDNSTC